MKMMTTALWLGASVLGAASALAFTPVPYERVPIPTSSATASTHDGNVPGNSIDDNFATRWSGYGDGAWVAYDLGAERSLTHVMIAVYGGNARKNKFELQRSSDGASWTTVTTGQSSGTTTALEPYQTPTTTRYLRYLGHGNVSNAGTTGAWNSVTELQVWARPAPPAAPVLRAFTGNGQVQLRWTAQGAGYQFYVRRRLQPCDPYALSLIHI